MAKRDVVKTAALALVVVLGFGMSYSMVGLPFSLIFLVVCFDSLVIGRIVKMGVETGIELGTFATILVAVLYGNWMALTFGVFMLPIITGVLG